MAAPWIAARRAAAAADPAEVYASSTVIDTLCGGGPGLDDAVVRAAGIDAVVLDLPIFPRAQAAAEEALARWKRRFEAPGAQVLPVLRGADLGAARERGALGVILACQDAAILGSPVYSVTDHNLEVLRRLHGAGLRVLQLCHNDRNGVADSFMEERDGGLSRLGERVVAEMGALGMIVDLSHCSDRSTAQAIRLSPKPCAVTHAGCRALHPSGRNKPDELIRALAEAGGVFGVFNMSVWLTGAQSASLDDVLDHVDHAVDVAGEDGVAFGSDGPAVGSSVPADQALAGFSGWVRRNLGRPGAERLPSHVTVAELRGPDRLERLARGLAGRGYGSRAIAKLLGGNFRRLLSDVCG